MQVSTLGLDLAKRLFQVHGVDASGAVVLRKQLRRSEVLKFFRQLAPCLVGMEACATSHYWAREIAALGHRVRQMPPIYVKPYVKRGKNDAADAAAICEAATRPSMRFVPTKSVAQQGILMLHRVRELLVRQRTMLANATRGHLAEFGVIAPQGLGHVGKLVDDASGPESALPEPARLALQELATQLSDIDSRIAKLDAGILAWHRESAVSKRLTTIPGIGPITASAIAATVPDPSVFRSGRAFAAWIGLVPRQHSSGGKQRLGGISKRGDAYLRRLLVNGASTVARYAPRKTSEDAAWLRGLLARRPKMVALVALANKTARIAWAVMTSGEPYRAAAAAAAR